MGVTATRKPFEGHRSLDFQKKVAMQKLETVTAKSERKKAVEQLNVIDRTRLQIPVLMKWTMDTKGLNM